LSAKRKNSADAASAASKESGGWAGVDSDDDDDDDEFLEAEGGPDEVVDPRSPGINPQTPGSNAFVGVTPPTPAPPRPAEHALKHEHQPSPMANPIHEDPEEVKAPLTQEEEDEVQMPGSFDMANPRGKVSQAEKEADEESSWGHLMKKMHVK